MAPYKRHLFVCTNERPAGHPRGCCKEKGAEEIREAFKKSLVAHGIKGEMRANAAGCLDTCEQGVSVVVYPDAVWYGAVTAADVEEIVTSHLVGGIPVERLRMKLTPPAKKA